MSDKITLKNIEEHITFFKKMYDAIRIVDPLSKRVVEYGESSLEETDDVCYEYWEDGKICDNCVAIRAHNHNKTFIKLEQTEDATMLVTAMPIDNIKRPTIIELFKNATDSMLIGEGDYNKGHMIRNMVGDLNKKAVEDALTSLYNRRFINERLPADIVKATIEGWPLSVIFMDIDGLKEINDVNGHKVGDYLLKEVGKAILSCIRDKGDWSARYGGDEFLICLNNAGDKEAQIVVDRIHETIGKIIVPADKSIKLTASMGIHRMKETKLTAEELIHEVDKKMYEDKKNRKRGN